MILSFLDELNFYMASHCNFSFCLTLLSLGQTKEEHAATHLENSLLHHPKDPLADTKNIRRVCMSESVFVTKIVLT